MHSLALARQLQDEQDEMVQWRERAQKAAARAVQREREIRERWRGFADDETTFPPVRNTTCTKLTTHAERHITGHVRTRL